LPSERIAMARDHLIDHNKPVFDHFHPKVYMIGLAFVVWFALAAWVLFDHKFDRVDDMALPLAMISALLLFVILLVAALTSVWKRHRLGDDGHAQNVAFRDWRLGNFAIWDGSLKSRDAAIDMLLPLAAAAFGLTAIGVVFLVCARLAS
jgi:hypothetical protein